MRCRAFRRATVASAFRQAGHRVAVYDIHRALGRPGSDLIAYLLGEDRDTGRNDVISKAHKALYGTYSDRLPPQEKAGYLLRARADQGWTDSAGQHRRAGPNETRAGSDLR